MDQRREIDGSVTKRRFRYLIILIVFYALILFFLPSVLFAGDTGIDGFNGLFFRPNVDGQGIVNVDTARVLFPGSAHVDSYFQFARRTISFSDPALGGLVTDLVENQVLSNLTLGVGLFEFLDAGLDVPIVFMQNGTNCANATCTTVSNYNGFSLGDMRFVFKLRILDEEKYPFGLALASDIGIPTGNRKLFTGGKNASYEQRFIASKSFKHVEVAANIGYRVVDRVEALGTIYDDSLTFGVGVRGKLPHHLYAFGTVSGNVFLSDKSSANTPVEFIGGVGHRWGNGVSCQVGGGARLVDGITAADFRILGSCGVDFGLTASARNQLNPSLAEKNSARNRPLEQWIIPMATNQSRLRSKQTEMLDDVIRYLSADRTRKVVIVGNADDRASYDYNMKLSTKRALAARNYLFGRSVGPEQVLIRTSGEVFPESGGKTDEDRGANRSILIREVRE
jgi:hypothetical protein